MKRNFFVCLIVMAQFYGLASWAQEGFTGPGLQVITVDAAKGLRDDQPVVLRGRIERSLGDEKYLFTDKTGSITVEIDGELWRGLSVNPNDAVEISGEVDKDFKRIEVDVDGIKKVEE
ncbi:MAG: NirD/YgiW/YdeI family stress tolerance protein [Spirochaetaceae bacterium]|jgi:uncharacterized protein (TIGR00156 family)|nr:NirD/YgiW/YdeI family stress tolerance protein [Spirochaetaceae bacterium]